MFIFIKPVSFMQLPHDMPSGTTSYLPLQQNNIEAMGSLDPLDKYIGGSTLNAVILLDLVSCSNQMMHW